MVRNYNRKREKAYTRETLLEAIQLVKQKKINGYVAAKQFNIPRSTIMSHVNATRGQKQINPGKSTVLSKSLEQEITSYLKIMEKNGFPLKTKEVKALVSEFIKRNGIITPFKEDIPGDEWFRGFRERNGLSMKKSQPVEIACKRACNSYTVYEYFDLLENVLNELDLTEKPEKIYNLEETSYCNDLSKIADIGEKGFCCTRTTSFPGRDTTSVLLATNAVGDKVPPFIIFQDEHLWYEWCYKESVKTAYNVSQNGRMETSIFEKYLRSVFLPAIGKDRPILLIYDGHSAHVDLNVIKLAQSENVTIIKLPPHSSETHQPLDGSGMKPIKDRWHDALVKWQSLHVGAKIPKNEFSRILTEIWTNLNPVILQKGFKKTGIYPFNRHAIATNKFDPLISAKRKKEQALNHAENNEVEHVNLFSVLEDPEAVSEDEEAEMENEVPKVCRACLATGLKMVDLAAGGLRDTFEHVTGTDLHTIDERPTQVCYVCCSQLQRFRAFCQMSRKAETYMTKLVKEGLEITEQTVSKRHHFIKPKLYVTNNPLIAIHTQEDPDECVTVEVKVEVENEVEDKNRTDSETEIGCEVKMETYMSERDPDTKNETEDRQPDWEPEGEIKIEIDEVDIEELDPFEAVEDSTVCEETCFCIQCAGAFPSQSELLKHIQNHTQKKVKQANTTRQNVKAKTSKRNVKTKLESQCKFCNNSFAIKTQLVTHVATEHGFGEFSLKPKRRKPNILRKVSNARR